MPHINYFALVLCTERSSPLLVSEKTTMNCYSCCIAKLTWWLWLVPRTLLQTPQLSAVISPRSLGECATFDVLMLGNHEEPSTTGLVSRSLLAAAMRRHQSSLFHTTENPSVQIMSAVVTCQSLALPTTRYSTTSVLVRYTCRGIACEQRPTNIQTLTYVHLFSFVCEESVNLYTTWDYVPGFRVFVDRITTNTIAHPNIAGNGSCASCINDPSLVELENPRFNSASGCLGMYVYLMLCSLESTLTNVIWRGRCVNAIS